MEIGLKIDKTMKTMKTILSILTILLMNISLSASTELQNLAIKRFQELKIINTEILKDESKRKFLQFIESQSELYGFKIDFKTYTEGNQLNDNPAMTTFRTVFAYSDDGGMCKIEHTTPFSRNRFINMECYSGDGKEFDINDGLIKVDF